MQQLAEQRRQPFLAHLLATRAHFYRRSVSGDSSGTDPGNNRPADGRDLNSEVDTGSGNGGDPRAPKSKPPSGWWRTRGALWLRVLLGGAAIVFVGIAGVDLWRQWDENAVEFNAAVALLSLLPLLAGSFTLGWAWQLILVKLEAKPIPRWPTIALHIEAQMARYVPGKVGVPLVRLGGAPSLGVAAGTVASSLFIELASFVATGGLFGVASLGLLRHPETEPALPIEGVVISVCALAAVTLALVVVDRRYLPAPARRLLRIEGHGTLLPARVPLLHLVYWATWALHGTLVIYAVGGDPAAALAGCGLFGLALIAGFLALVAPAGIGVREAVLSVGLVAALGPVAAVTAALISRVATLVADVGAWLLSRPLRSPKQNVEPPTSR